MLLTIWGWIPGGAVGSLPQAAAKTRQARVMPRSEFARSMVIASRCRMDGFARVSSQSHLHGGAPEWQCPYRTPRRREKNTYKVLFYKNLTAIRAGSSFLFGRRLKLIQAPMWHQKGAAHVTVYSFLGMARDKAEPSLLEALEIQEAHFPEGHRPTSEARAALDEPREYRLDELRVRRDSTDPRIRCPPLLSGTRPGSEPQRSSCSGVA